MPKHLQMIIRNMGNMTRYEKTDDLVDENNKTSKLFLSFYDVGRPQLIMRQLYTFLHTYICILSICF